MPVLDAPATTIFPSGCSARAEERSIALPTAVVTIPPFPKLPSRVPSDSVTNEHKVVGAAAGHVADHDDLSVRLNDDVLGGDVAASDVRGHGAVPREGEIEAAGKAQRAVGHVAVATIRAQSSHCRALLNMWGPPVATRYGDDDASVKPHELFCDGISPVRMTRTYPGCPVHVGGPQRPGSGPPQHVCR